jgi:phosphoribosyl 1,2-cyclic phosphate phosphodiesterase
MRITVLGCGASVGVPVIGCDCAVCSSDNPRNKRSRVSVLVEYASGFRVLVDTSPDMRNQCLANDISDIDAIIYTHAHADHSHGIDDIRPFNARKNAAIPAFGTQETLNELRQRFGYAWQPHDGGYWSRTALEAKPIEAGELIILPSGDRVQSFAQEHGKGSTLGLRFGDFVYSTDVSAFPAESVAHLAHMRCWIVDCLRDGFSGSHANLETALQWAQQYRPARTILTHMNHELDYESLKLRLPPSVEPAFDGMVIEL